MSIDPIVAQRNLDRMFRHFNTHLFNDTLLLSNVIVSVSKLGPTTMGRFELNHTTEVENKGDYESTVIDLAIRKEEHKRAQDLKIKRFGGRRTQFKDKAAEAKLKTLIVPTIHINTLVLDRPMKATAATLVHEMVHLWQYRYGARFPKSGTHNAEWADKMVKVGLTPVCVDGNAKPGQKTGKNCTHDVVDGGPFDAAFAALPEELKMTWVQMTFSRPKTTRKITYQCDCGRKFYSSKGMSDVLCKLCLSDFVKQKGDEDEDAVETPPESKIEAPTDQLGRSNGDLDSVFDDEPMEWEQPCPADPRENPDLDLFMDEE